MFMLNNRSSWLYFLKNGWQAYRPISFHSFVVKTFVVLLSYYHQVSLQKISSTNAWKARFNPAVYLSNTSISLFLETFCSTSSNFQCFQSKLNLCNKLLIELTIHSISIHSSCLQEVRRLFWLVKSSFILFRISCNSRC